MDHSHHSHLAHSDEGYGGESHGSFGSYTVGFILSVVLQTVSAALGLVLDGRADGSRTSWLAIACASRSCRSSCI